MSLGIEPHRLGVNFGFGGFGFTELIQYSKCTRTKFSSRFTFDPQLPRETIFEDAPEGVRIAYLNGILEPVTYGDRGNEANRPLATYSLSKQSCAIARQEMPDLDRFSSLWDDLKWLIKEASWFNFYDFVETGGLSTHCFPSIAIAHDQTHLIRKINRRTLPCGR